MTVKSHEASGGGRETSVENWEGRGGKRAKNRRGESGKPNNRPAPTSVSVRSYGEKEEMKWTVRLTGIYILSCAICVSELCRVTVRRIRSGKSVIITRARRSPKHPLSLRLSPSSSLSLSLLHARAPVFPPVLYRRSPAVRFSHRHLTAWNTKINNDSPRGGVAPERNGSNSEPAKHAVGEKTRAVTDSFNSRAVFPPRFHDASRCITTRTCKCECVCTRFPLPRYNTAIRLYDVSLFPPFSRVILYSYLGFIFTR